MRHLSRLALSPFPLLALILASGCATTAPSAAEQQRAKELESLRTEVTELHGALARSQARVDSLETRLGTVSERMNGLQSGIGNLLANHKAIGTPVIPPPASTVGARPQSETAASDPESGFTNDEAVQSYRKAATLHGAGRYSDAMLAFTGFLEKYPDHALAGSAQFYVGDCYFKQKEFKLAAAELERVLTSYDRSAHVADSLQELAEAEEQLKQPEKAARHRQQLSALFPQSPAAAALSAGVPQQTSGPSSVVAPAVVPALPPAAAPGAPSTSPPSGAPAASDENAPPTAPIGEGTRS
jgi:TolA-binding protein